MKTYLENRESMIVNDSISESYIDEFNTKEYIGAFLSRADSIIEQVSNSATFMDQEMPNVRESIDSLFSSLESKLSVITNSAIFISRVNREFSSSVDISHVDMSKLKYTNMKYSHTDQGVILGSTTSRSITGQ